MRRNKLALAVMLIIVGLALTTTFLWRQAVDERAQAVRERTRTERVSDFLENLFESADPDESRGDDVKVREILDRGRERIADELEDEPEMRAEVLGTLGNVYKNLGLYDQARELREEALATCLESSSRDRRSSLSTSTTWRACSTASATTRGRTTLS